MRNDSSKQDAFGLLTTAQNVIHAAVILHTESQQELEKETERK